MSYEKTKLIPVIVTKHKNFYTEVFVNKETPRRELNRIIAFAKVFNPNVFLEFRPDVKSNW